MGAIFKGVLFALDSLEIIVATIFGTALFFGIPFYVIRSLINKGHLFLSVCLSLVVIASFGICVRDFRKKKWSGISILIAVLWIICLASSGWILMS